MNLLIKGIVIGFSIAAPVGPIGILCIRKTLQFGKLSGFFTGLGAAFADMFYGAIAAFGLTLISNFLIQQELCLKMIGGGFLIYLGMKTFRSSPSGGSQNILHKTFFKDFITTFFLTLTNPITIFAFLAIFAGLGAFSKNHPMWIVFGIFLGSCFWWLILSQGVALFRKKMEGKAMVWINRIAGLIIIAFGLFAWISLIKYGSLP